MTTNISNTANINQITLAGGCFWCIESAFNSVRGIITAVSGYMGGHTDSPKYRDIITGQTGHAEVVQLTFDENLISVRELFEIFFTLHNPTQLNRQGNDIGTQYRSAVFFHNDSQKQSAVEIIKEIDQDKMWPSPVVTEVTAQSTFYSGEQFHQDFFNKNPENPYCQALISPKMAKFKQTFVNKLK
ncbi:MAG: peptide-methionine (S)-S-oxide reductase MsrA [Colwellia sp.]|nr:peptide-methionine (S)-S-oxide reductase MsrA [Colwellia sp.]